MYIIEIDVRNGVGHIRAPSIHPQQIKNYVINITYRYIFNIVSINKRSIIYISRSSIRPSNRLAIITSLWSHFAFEARQFFSPIAKVKQMNESLTTEDQLLHACATAGLLINNFRQSQPCDRHHRGHRDRQSDFVISCY